MAKKVNWIRQLIESLKGEKKRLTENNNQFDQRKKITFCGSFVASEFLSYVGPFNYTFKTNILFKKVFKEDLAKRGIPI